jgi:hypothetical protein
MVIWMAVFLSADGEKDVQVIVTTAISGASYLVTAGMLNMLIEMQLAWMHVATQALTEMQVRWLLHWLRIWTRPLMTMHETEGFYRDGFCVCKQRDTSRNSRRDNT